MSKYAYRRTVLRQLMLAWMAMALGSAIAGCGQDPAGAIAVSGAWVKEPVPGKAMAAGYLKIENRGKGEEVLLGIECADAAAVEMHDMAHEDGMMKMRKMEQWTIPGHGSMALAPGGGHLMFLGLRRELKDGDTVQLTLHFKGAGDRTLSVPVKKQ
jgi:copper(I)-binding protein